MMGYEENSTLYPVVGFTCDEAENCVNRARVYKCCLVVVGNRFEDSIRKEIMTALDSRPPGYIVNCNRDGSFSGAISVSELELF